MPGDLRNRLLAVAGSRPFRWALTFWALAAWPALIHIVVRYPPAWSTGVAVAFVTIGAVIAVPMEARLRLLLALILGVTLRIAAWSTFDSFPSVDDPFSLYDLASNVLAGNGLAVHDPIYGELHAAFPPLYSLVLAGWRWCGGHWLALNTLIDVLASAALFVLSGGSARAAAAYFLFPSVILASVLPEKEGLACLLVMGCMLLVPRNAVLYGLVAALVALTQPAWLFIPVIGFVLLRPVADVFPAAIGGAIGMLPWWIRNWLIFGQFVPLTTTPGLSLAIAYNSGHVSPPNMDAGEIERAAAAGKLAAHHIAEHSGRYMGNVARMFGRAMLVDDDTIDYLKNMPLAWLNAAAIAGQLAWAALIGVAAHSAGSIRRLSTIDAFLLAWAGCCLVNTWLEFTTRHRAFAVPILILWATENFRERSGHGCAKRRACARY